MPEMYEYPAEVLIIFFQTMVKLLYLRLLQETQHVFFQLAAPLARDDLNLAQAFLHRLADHPTELAFNRPVIVIDIMQIQLDPAHRRIASFPVKSCPGYPACYCL